MGKGREEQRASIDERGGGRGTKGKLEREGVGERCKTGSR